LAFPYNLFSEDYDEYLFIKDYTGEEQQHLQQELCRDLLQQGLFPRTLP
jgi:hypothetical protein